MGKFLNAYIGCALWSSTDDAGTPLDQNYTADDIAPETRVRMERDCGKFLRANEHLIAGEFAAAGYDFWLTRQRHGAGFWDGDWPDNVAPDLTMNAHAYGEVSLYVGDDGKIHAL